MFDLTTTRNQEFVTVDSPIAGRGVVLLTKTVIQKSLSYWVETISLFEGVPYRTDIGYISITGKRWAIFDRNGDAYGTMYKTWQEALEYLCYYFA